MTYVIIERESYITGYTRNGVAFTFDKADYDMVKKHSWHLSKKGYISTKRKGKVVPLHKVILNYPSWMEVDHISRDRTDNRRSNLRICNHQENCFNQSLKRTNTSGYIGVSRAKRVNAYEAYIHFCGRKYHIGTFDDSRLAAKVRDNAASMLFGEYASLNFPKECGEITG